MEKDPSLFLAIDIKTPTSRKANLEDIDEGVESNGWDNSEIRRMFVIFVR